MSDLLTFSITVFTGFFAIMNPIANIPVFLGLVGDQDKASKRRIAKTATITAFFIVASSAILGFLIYLGLQYPHLRLLVGYLFFMSDLKC